MSPRKVDISQLPIFSGLGLENLVCFLIYVSATNNQKISESIEVDIDINQLDETDNDGLVSKEERIQALEQLKEAGVVEVLHSSSWNHHKLLVHPVQKIFQERKKAKKNRKKARKERKRNAT